jgi:hypothetical protein
MALIPPDRKSKPTTARRVRRIRRRKERVSLIVTPFNAAFVRAGEQHLQPRMQHSPLRIQITYQSAPTFITLLGSKGAKKCCRRFKFIRYWMEEAQLAKFNATKWTAHSSCRQPIHSTRAVKVMRTSQLDCRHLCLKSLQTYRTFTFAFLCHCELPYQLLYFIVFRSNDAFPLLR